MLTDHEARVLTAVCDTFVASLPDVSATAGSPAYWNRCAGDFGVPAAIARILSEQEDEEGRKRFRLLLRLLDQPLSVALHGGGPTPFHRLPLAQREAVLRRWENSPLLAERQGYQVLKRLTGLVAFSLAECRTEGCASPTNPNWADLRYPGPGPENQGAPFPRISAVEPLTITAGTTLEADVVVIGSGAGGGVVAACLAQAGKSVIILEQGPFVAPEGFHGRELEAMQALYWSGGLLGSHDRSVSLLAGACVGGGTTINWLSSFRPPERLRQEWEAAGIEGLTGPDFDAAIDAVEARVAVTDTESACAPESRDGRFAAGCQRLGYAVHPMRRNARGCGDCGWCGFGCPRSAKQSTLVTFLEDAAACGARMVAHCRAEKILIENGRATGVLARVRDSQSKAEHPITVRAKAVVVAAGAIGSPALLQRSGLTNPNIGRHLHLHPTVPVLGAYPEPTYPWSGVTQARYSDRFADLVGGYGFLLETAPAHPGLLAVVTPWLSARQYKEAMLEARNLCGTIVLTRDRGEGTVRANAEGRPIIRYRMATEDAGIS